MSKTIGIDVRCLMDSHYSGVAEYTHNLLKNIFEIDKSNQYKLFFNSAKTVKMPDFKNVNVNYHDFDKPNKLLNAGFKLFNTPKIDKMINGCDIFFLPNLNFAAVSRKSIKIITVHDLSFETQPDFFSAKAKLWHKIINPKKLISNCDKIIAVSQNTKNDLMDIYNIEEQKIKVIYSGISDDYKLIDKKDYGPIRIKTKYGLPSEFILYLGNIDPRKNIQALIQSFIELKQDEDFRKLNLVIVGKQTAYAKKLIQWTLSQQNSHDIKFIDYIPAEEKVFFYNLAKIFIFPSFFEGFGFPPLEAQKCGTPVISSNNSSLTEILKVSASYINPYKSSDITKAIKLITTNDEYRKELINKGRNNAERFTWRETAKETLEYLMK